MNGIQTLKNYSVKVSNAHGHSMNIYFRNRLYNNVIHLIIFIIYFLKPSNYFETSHGMKSEVLLKLAWIMLGKKSKIDHRNNIGLRN